MKYFSSLWLSSPKAQKIYAWGSVPLFAVVTMITITTASGGPGCSAPAGVEGEQIYNSAFHVMQYCDGDDWVAMNAIDANAAVTTLEQSKVSKSGDSMTGLLSLSGAPTSNLHAATKGYVDSIAAATGDSATAGRYQISCSSPSTSYVNCVMLDTQTWQTQCMNNYNISSTIQEWVPCGTQMNVSSLDGQGLSSTTVTGLRNAYGWGSNNLYHGNGNASASSPSLLDLNLAFTKIVSTQSNSQPVSCGIASWKPYCWWVGANYWQKGNISSPTSNTPSPAPLELSSLGFPEIVDIEVWFTKWAIRGTTGQWWSYGNTLNGSVIYNFWGTSTNLQPVFWRTGSAGTTTAWLPLDFEKVKFADYHMCGLRSNGKVHCTTYGWTTSPAFMVSLWDGIDEYCTSWGGNIFRTNSAFLQELCPVAGSEIYTDIAVWADRSSCALRDNGQVYCWGYTNADGKLWKWNTTNGTGYATPVDNSLNPWVTYASIYGSSTSNHFCALSTSWSAYCWWDNGSWQLGTGDASDRVRPTRVLWWYTFTQLELNYNQTCGLTTWGVMLCWGASSVYSSFLPEPVTWLPEGITGIAVWPNRFNAWK